MKRSEERYTWISRAGALLMVLAVLSIPLMRAVHHHTASYRTAGWTERLVVDGVAVPAGTADTDHGDTDHPNCDLCIFFAHYVPQAAASETVWSFAAPEQPAPANSGKPADGRPCHVLLSGDITRGPPFHSSCIGNCRFRA